MIMDNNFIKLDDGMVMKNIENNPLFSVDYLEIEPGAIEENIYHEHLTEWIYLTEGELEFFLDGEVFTLKKGEYVHINKNAVHGSVNKTKKLVKMISVCSPPFQILDMKKLN